MRKKPTKKIKPHELTAKTKTELAVNEIINPHNEYYTSVYHAVNPGDLIAAMGAMKKYYEITKRKLKVLQSISQKAAYYGGAIHPTVNERGENVCVNLPMWNMLKPLIESQEYIHSFEKYEGQKIDLDFNVIRAKTPVNLPYGAIQNWIPLAFPDLAFDISKAWMFLDGNCPKHIKEQVKGKIILNFTERYRNEMIDYFFLKNYAPDLIFAGTEKEAFLFCNKWQLNIPRLEVKDFLELGYAMKESKFFLGNQSMCWNLCTALGTKRILEICGYAPNCIHSVGDGNEGFMYQVGVEYYFRLFYNQTIK